MLNDKHFILAAASPEENGYRALTLDHPDVIVTDDRTILTDNQNIYICYPLQAMRLLKMASSYFMATSYDKIIMSQSDKLAQFYLNNASALSELSTNDTFNDAASFAYEMVKTDNQIAFPEAVRALGTIHKRYYSGENWLAAGTLSPEWENRVAAAKAGLLDKEDIENYFKEVFNPSARRYFLTYSPNQELLTENKKIIWEVLEELENG